jgi:hypothetical protein
LGSFFEKHESDDNDQTLAEQDEDDNGDSSSAINESECSLTTHQDNWLITPLPCLTSITQSAAHRSIIESDPLENLLIEHPSMSVFVTATSSTILNEICSDEDNYTLPSELRLKDSTNVVKMVDAKAINKSVAEKRKEVDIVVMSSSPASPTMRTKRGRKNKKSVSPCGLHVVQPQLTSSKSGNNKENAQQVKTIPAAGFKRAGNASRQTEHRLLNKNQMKRNNKLSTISSTRNVNSKQRKYHQLQQPAFTLNYSSNQF